MMPHLHSVTIILRHAGTTQAQIELTADVVDPAVLLATGDLLSRHYLPSLTGEVRRLTLEGREMVITGGTRGTGVGVTEVAEPMVSSVDREGEASVVRDAMTAGKSGEVERQVRSEREYRQHLGRMSLEGPYLQGGQIHRLHR